MIKVLVVDDEEKIRMMIDKYAKFEGFDVTLAKDGLEAVCLCRENDYDVIVMDIMMPDLDGFSASKEIKKIKDIPIIFLSALQDEYIKLKGFDIGIDDYVVKPFSSKELMMRIKAIYNRVNKYQKNSFVYEKLIINFDARTVIVEDEKIDLSLKEFELLIYLVKNCGRALTREQIIQNVWGYDYFGDDRTLDTHIKLLRKSLKKYSKCIVTLRGVGYRFEKAD